VVSVTGKQEATENNCRGSVQAPSVHHTWIFSILILNNSKNANNC